MRRKWRGMPPEDIKDAVSEAMVDLWAYWVDLPSSWEEGSTPGRSFRYAVRRGCWTANNAIVKQYHEYGRRPPTAVDVMYDIDDHSRDDYTFVNEETPEDLVVSVEDRDAIRRAIDSLTDEERERWFDAFISGMTTVEAAELAEVDQSAVVRRRRVGLRKLAAKLNGVAA